MVDFKREPWPRVSEPAKDLVRRMLDPNPLTRFTAAQVLGKPHYHLFLLHNGLRMLPLYDCYLFGKIES